MSRHDIMRRSDEEDADPWSARLAPWRHRHEEPGRDRGVGGMPAAAVLGLGLALAAGGAAAAVALSRGREERPFDDAPERSAKGSARRGREAVVGRTVTIAKPRSELYAYWRDFEHLPEFMEAVDAVRVEGERQHVWTLKVPGGTARIRTEITEEREGEAIAWASTEGSDMEMRGHVRFEDAPGGRGTRVEAEVAYVPPGGELGRALAKILQREPRIQARRELKRFKMLMEAGEIATAQNRRAA